MRDTIARIADIVADLNGTMNQISDNEELEFSVDKRLQVLETATDDLSTEVNNVVEFASETAEG
ncbi:hypothetical protein LCGC14_1495700 [marine sediment metagenome]|uniref:Uncharacterized protein n=1 Tax=marine sediment metagenome TaxID=412755 RepID=A0A0F9M726_9ZZZZ